MIVILKPGDEDIEIGVSLQRLIDISIGHLQSLVDGTEGEISPEEMESLLKDPETTLLTLQKRAASIKNVNEILALKEKDNDHH